MGTTEDLDVPKVVAAVIYKMPGLAIKVGVKYLSMRVHAHRASKEFRRGMTSGGMPEELARRLSDDYAVDLSLISIMKGLAKDS